MKSSEGQLSSERLKDIFLVAYLFIFSRIFRIATHFVITVKKSITGNKLYVLKLPCEKILFKLLSNLLEILFKFQFCEIQFITNDSSVAQFHFSARSGMQKNKRKRKCAYKTKVCGRLRNSNCFLLFIT